MALPKRGRERVYTICLEQESTLAVVNLLRNASRPSCDDDSTCSHCLSDGSTEGFSARTRVHDDVECRIHAGQIPLERDQAAPAPELAAARWRASFQPR